MGLIDALRSFAFPVDERTSYIPTGSEIDAMTSMLWSGRPTTTYGTEVETIGAGYVGLIRYTYAGNAVVFACMQARMLLFTEARFCFRRISNGVMADAFGTPELAILEHPWPGGTTGDLLKAVITSADLAGVAFIIRPQRDRLAVLRPDWVEMIYADLWASSPELLGIAYYPGGKHSGAQAEFFQAGEFAYFAPYPDPESPYAGMPWLTPVLREVMADTAATTHKLKFFENGATPNLVVSLNLADPARFREWINVFEQGHRGYLNAYKTLYLGGGADAKIVGADLKQIDFKLTQGAGETRIAAAAGVPPIIVGLSEGLQAATYSNYGQARRRLADLTMRPLWRNLAGSLEAIIPTPAGANLWYADGEIPFLAEDKKDAADVQAQQAQAIRTLTDGGYTPESVIAAVTGGDLRKLTHTGLLPVQLQPPGSGEPDPGPDAPGNDTTSAPDAGRRDIAALLEPLLHGSRR